jgi:hypothetical protein
MVIMSRPKKKPESLKKSLSVTLSPSLLRGAEALREHTGESISSLIERLLLTYIAKEKKLLEKHAKAQASSTQQLDG